MKLLVRSEQLRGEIEEAIAAFESETGATVGSIQMRRRHEKGEPPQIETLNVHVERIVIKAGREEIPF